MPELKWKETELQTPTGKVKVTHWEKHNPVQLLRLVARKPVRILGEHPPVAIHRFGPHLLSLREFSPKYEENFLNPEKLFQRLQELVALKTAIFEMPVAFIQRGSKPPVILTLYKKRTSDFIDFVKNKRIPVEKREKAAIGAMRRLAELHASGFVHGHPLNNIVVDRNGNAMLVDYTFLDSKQRLVHANETEIELHPLAIAYGWADAVHGKKPRKIRGPLLAGDFSAFAKLVREQQHVEEPPALKELAEKLEHAYGDTYAKHVAKLKRIKS